MLIFPDNLAHIFISHGQHAGNGPEITKRFNGKRIIFLYKAHRLVGLFHFQGFAHYLAVGGNDSVHTEITVVQSLPEIASVPEALALEKHAVIRPFPDAAAHRLWIFIKQIPIILEITRTVAHSM